MYVKIGKYRSWIGSYQICDLLKHFGVSDDTCYKLGEKLSNTFVQKICEWVDSKKHRKVKVKIHDYDAWSMDSTLAYIIPPMLKQLKQKQHGAPFVDDTDVPENLRSTNAPKKENDWDTDMWHFERWDWVLDKMIWAFEQIHPDNDWESQYHTGNIDILWKPVKSESGEEMSEMTKGPKDTHTFDKEGYMAHNKEIEKGLILFGKYFRSLWD